MSSESRDVILVCDEPLVASALSSLLASDGRFRMTAIASSADLRSDVWAKARASGRSAIVVFDVGGMTSTVVECIASITASTGFPVIVLTAIATIDMLAELLDAGARGIVGRDAAPEELIAAVNEVGDGHAFASRELLTRVLELIVQRPRIVTSVKGTRTEDALAPRERDVVRLVMRGMTNREIAATLHLSETTVKAHLGKVMVKWRVRDRLQVALHALGQLEPPRAR